jgi:serine/threonine protein kinase
MVMDLLGPSLEDLFTRCSRKFSLKTVLQIADQILERIDCLHQRHLIHRDIKPANFTIGINETSSSIYCVDFGLSKRYRHPKTLQHIPHRDGRSLTGTPRYASINNHLGIEQSRRDDLESVGYILVYFLKGALPWQGLKAKNAQKKYRLILEKKQQVSIAQLCSGLPSQFAEFLAYSRALKFDAKPDIPYLRKLFRDLYHAQGLSSISKVWDWDDMEMDYGDGTSPTAAMANGAGGMLPGVMTSTPSGLLRPSTAAAVGGGGMMMDISDRYDHDGYDDNLMQDRARPSTTGGNQIPLNSLATNAKYLPTAGLLPNTTSNPTGWTYGSRPTAPEPVDNTGSALFQARRPHTAHGGRAGEEKLPPTSSAAAVEEEDGDDHVVATTRAMMRYRRTKTDTPVGIAGSTPMLPTTSAQQQRGISATATGYDQAMAAPALNYSGKQASYTGPVPTGRINQPAVYPTRSQVPMSTTSSGARQSIISATGTNVSTQAAAPAWVMVQGDRPKSASTNNPGLASGNSLL